MLFRFRYQQLGAHTHIRVFAGKSEAGLGRCGVLCFRNEEWSQFKGTLEAATSTLKTLAPVFEFVPEGEDYRRDGTGIG